MPDLLNRFSHEEHIAYGLAVELQRQRRKLVAYGVERLPERPAVEWEKDKEELAAVLLLMLRNPWSSSYYGLAGGEGVIARPDEIEREFQRWAAEYATTTAGQITDTTKEAAIAAAVLMATLPNPFLPQAPAPAGMPTTTTTGGATTAAATNTSTTTTTAEQPTAREIERARTLADVAADKRIVRGAISMTTDAASAGEFAVAELFHDAEAKRVARETAAADEIEKSTGTRPVVKPARTATAYWHTERDGRVCKICKPLDGQPEKQWREKYPNGPKAHVACRCYLDWRME